MVRAAEAAVKTVEEYVDIPEEALRSAGGSLDIEAIGNYLPDDLSTLTRTTGARNAAGEAETTNLEAELERIAEEFDTAVSALVPSLEGVELPEGFRIENGLLWTSEDEQVSLHSMEGIAIAEVLLTQARGDNVEEVITLMSSEIEKITEDGNIDARGIYSKKASLWPNGIIRYRWDSSVNSEYRRSTRAAMDEWERKTGKISFKETYLVGFNLFIYRIGALKVLTIRTKELPETTGGLLQ